MNFEPDYLAKKYPDDREKNIIFYPDDHRYVINGDDSYISGTTFVHRFVEEFNSDKIIHNMMKSRNWNNSKYYGMTIDEIKLLWDENKNEASGAGTKLHFDIECFYNMINNNNNSIEWSYFIKFYNDYKHLIPYRSEFKVYHEELKLVGTIDMIFMDKNDPNIIEIYDWKRSKEIIKKSNFGKWMKGDILSHLPDTNFWHYSLQLNIYKAIIEAKYSKKVVGLYLVCLHPNNKNSSYQRIKCADLSSEVAELFNDRINEVIIA